MFDSKYSKVLTVLLIIIVIVILGLLGFVGYDIYKKYHINRNSDKVLEEFDNKIAEQNTNTNTNTQENVVGEVVTPNLTNETQVPSATQGSSAPVTYEGFNVSGKIEIPAIDLEYPVLEKVTKSSIEVAVAILAGPGLNEVGNTVIVGHNYRNGLFFANNKKLKNGDKVYITDNSGQKITYEIYNIYQTTAEDFEYATRDTMGKREISLSTCTDDIKGRLVIWAKEV